MQTARDITASPPGRPMLRALAKCWWLLWHRWSTSSSTTTPPTSIPKIRAWLDRHERFVFHFTPTSCSWLNAVEGFFARLSRRRLKRGVFRSVVHLQAAINRFLAETNAEPKPFTWTADPDKIIAAVRRGHQALDSIR